MFEHKLSKKITLYVWLSSIFLTCAITAEIIGVKIFSMETVLGFKPIDITILGFTNHFDLPAGFILWPIVFITTDIINEYFGKDGVRKISIITAAMISIVFLSLYITTQLPATDWWISGGNQNQDLNIPNPDHSVSFVFRQGIGIIIGSLIAFLIGQLLDATLFQAIKRITGERYIWLRATGSTFISQLFDSFIVLIIAFKVFGGYEWSKVIAMSMGGYIYKVTLALLLTPLIYLAHYIIDKYLGEKLSERMIHNSN